MTTQASMALMPIFLLLTITLLRFLPMLLSILERVISTLFVTLRIS